MSSSFEPVSNPGIKVEGRVVGSLSIEFRIVRSDWSSRFLTKLIHSFLFNFCLC